jgi:2',3'-cyclic-nucleotide 2'-phosphodiesterase (5'-nucleotidase family)
VAEVDPESYRFDKYNKIDADSSLVAFIEPYKQQLDAEMNEVIGEVGTVLTKKRPESTLGNFVADLVLTQAEKCSGVKVDFAAQNYGGIRVPEVSTGPFTKSKAFDIMPFENMVTVIEAKGTVVKQLFNKMAASNGWPISKTVQLVLNQDRLSDAFIKGELLDESKTYVFALPDYIANGGDGCDFLIEQKRLPCNVSVRDAIINHVRELTASGEKITATLSDRIINK